MTPTLQIQGLRTTFELKAGGARRSLPAVDGLDLVVDQGEMVGLVGESGCGKSMTALSVMGLVPPPGRVSGGSILFQGRELAGAPAPVMRSVRGAEIAMIFQEPMTSLNPVFTVGRQVAEGPRLHQGLSRSRAWDKAVAALEQVGIPDAARRASSYPHQLSGGMRQRVMIAMALAMEPRLVIADEPTTALDVTIQAQILRLLAELTGQAGRSCLLITHDLAVVAQMCSRVAVMYTGRAVEQAGVDDLFRRPLHPYTQGLMACLPSRGADRGQRLPTIAGTVPPLWGLPRGCKFRDRCPSAFEPCGRSEPALVEVAPGHHVRCYLHHGQSEATGERAA